MSFLLIAAMCCRCVGPAILYDTSEGIECARITTQIGCKKSLDQHTVAYYQHSAQDRQENSIPIQRDQALNDVRKFAGS